jgi:hypothetical protein
MCSLNRNRVKTNQIGQYRLQINLIILKLQNYYPWNHAAWVRGDPRPTVGLVLRRCARTPFSEILESPRATPRPPLVDRSNGRFRALSVTLECLASNVFQLHIWWCFVNHFLIVYILEDLFLIKETQELCSKSLPIPSLTIPYIVFMI